MIIFATRRDRMQHSLTSIVLLAEIAYSIHRQESNGPGHLQNIVNPAGEHDHHQVHRIDGRARPRASTPQHVYDAAIAQQEGI